MGQAFWQTIALLRRRPTLWLPQLCAMCLVLLVQKLDNLAAGAIWHLLLRPRAVSVLGGTPVPPAFTASLAIKRTALTFPLLLFTDFIQIALCTTALLVVATLVHRFMCRLPTDPQSTLPSGKRSRSAIINIALSMVLLFMLKLLLVIPVMSWMLSRPSSEHMPFWRLQALDWISNTILWLAALYFVVPIALRATQASEPFSPSLQKLRSARIFAALSTILGIALQLLWQRIQRNLYREVFNPSWLWFFSLGLISIVISAAVLTFLSTAFGVLAESDPEASLNHQPE